MDQELVESLVAEHGEPYRKLIEHFLSWIDEQEPLWGLDEPVNRREAIAGLVERAVPPQTEEE